MRNISDFFSRDASYYAVSVTLDNRYGITNIHWKYLLMLAWLHIWRDGKEENRKEKLYLWLLTALPETWHLCLKTKNLIIRYRINLRNTIWQIYHDTYDIFFFKFYWWFSSICLLGRRLIVSDSVLIQEVLIFVFSSYIFHFLFQDRAS